MVYLVVIDEAINTAIAHRTTDQKPVYFISRVLQGPKTRYQTIEKLALVLVDAPQRLQHYFQSHEMIVKNDCPISKVLRKPKLAGRMIAWSVELSKFEIEYEPQEPIKSQYLADFISEL